MKTKMANNEEKKYIMVQRLLVTFMSEYIDESLEELQAKFEEWADNNTESELAFNLGDDAEVKKIYKDAETKEIFYSKEDILRSMFEKGEESS